MDKSSLTDSRSMFTAVANYILFRLSHPGAYRLGQLASQGDNIEKFLMGRQVHIYICLQAKGTTQVAV